MSCPAPNPPQPSDNQTIAYKVVIVALYFGPPIIMTWHTWQLGVLWFAGFAWITPKMLKAKRR